MSQVALIVLIFSFGLIQGQTLPNNVEVTIPTGKVGGQLINFRGTTIYQFLGIPFAQPPINELRLKKPVPAKPWEGVKSSTYWPPHCPQGLMPGFNTGYQCDEDCLTLNVFTPSSAVNGVGKLRPVMVWIHGGGFAYGSAHFDQYNGTVLASLEDVVFVSINYRLGALGFLHLPEHGINGNLGLWDQRLALLWVKDNIKHFGGDANEVTIFGESAGSMSVSALIVSPQTRGLFKNAILQSGSMYNISLWYNPKSAETLLEKTNCKSADKVADCLQSADLSVLTSLDGFLFWPVHGDDFIPEDPSELIRSIDSNVNILLGVVGNEGVGMLISLDPVTFDSVNPVNITLEQTKNFISKLYGPSLVDYIVEKFLHDVDPNNPNDLRLAIASTVGDLTLGCPTYMFGADTVKYDKGNVYAYHQSQKPSKQMFEMYPKSNWMPATHGEDVPMMFGHPLNFTDHDSEDVILSMIMVNIWGHFAKTGETPKLGSQEWFKWKLNDDGKVEMFVMELNSQKLGQVNNKLAERCYQNWPFQIEKINLNIGNQSEPDNHDEL